MAISTTQSIWRSGGGDQTRTALCGTGGMYLPFYIANSSATANIVNSSANSQALVLPAGAVIVGINITNTTTGGNSAVNIGYTPLITVGPGQPTTLGTNVPAAFVNAGNVATRTTFNIASATAGASMGNVANATNLIVLTCAAGAAGATGVPVTGSVHYYVADPLNGVQNV
jgi:hypothetical protein